MMPELVKEFEGYGEYVIIDKTTTDDGYGGTIPVYKEGAHFMATVTLDDSVQTKIAEAQGVKGLYRVTTQKNVRLPWHTIFKSKDGSKTFRVTSKDENAAPARSTVDIRYVSAEQWELTDNEQG